MNLIYKIMDFLTIIIFILLICAIAYIVYINMQYVIISKDDKSLNAGMSFLDENYLNNYVNNLNKSV